MANETWTIKSCLAWTEGYLRDKGEERPNLAAEWLMCAAAGFKTRTELYMNMNEPLSGSELEAMHRAVVRRAQGEPLQYITGETQFRTIAVKCAPGVLIPRPETELLVENVLEFVDKEVLGGDGRSLRKRAVLPWNAQVEQALEEERAAAQASADAEPTADSSGRGDEKDVFGARAYTDELAEREEDAAAYEQAVDELAEEGPDEDAQQQEVEPRRARVLEVGCGTGCISLSIAAERRGQVFCFGTDIDPKAVELSERNREDLGLTTDDVVFLRTNLVSKVPDDMWYGFDVLVSNPPYIPTDVMSELPSEVVDHEPALALDGGPDGLVIYRRLINAAPHMLKLGGLFICELYEGACDAAAELCRQAGFEDVRVIEDLTHRPRFVSARIPLDFDVEPLPGH